MYANTYLRYTNYQTENYFETIGGYPSHQPSYQELIAFP